MKSLLFILPLASLAFQAVAQQQPPNIIHIIADDLGYDDLSCFGSKYYRTPNLDKLAQQGTRLTNFYAPHATCTPSRTAVMTGRISPRVNDKKGLPVLFPFSKEGLDPEKEIAFPRLLKARGYATALLGKWHIGHLPQYLPPQHGFDYYLGIPFPNDHGPERLGNTNSYGLDSIPLMKNNDVAKRLDNNEIAELPGLFVRETCMYMEKCVKEKKPFYIQYSNIETHTPWFIPKGFEGKSKYGAYGDAVEYLDMSVGIILGYLQKLGIEDNTIIVFHADNGPLVHPYPELELCYGRYAAVDTALKHILREGKYQERFEGGPRVAAIVKWSGNIPAGTVNAQLLSGADLFTTFLHVAGAEVPQDRAIDGKDILPLLKSNNAQQSVRNTFFSFGPRGALQAVRYKQWKLVHAKENRQLLFNLEKDISEKQNLAGKYPQIVQQLAALGEEAKKAVAEDKVLPENNQLTF